MMNFTLGTLAQRLQPLVFLGNEVYAMTRLESASAALVTALGVEHALRPLGSLDTLREHHLRINAPGARQLLQIELARVGAARCSDPLRYFVEYLGPVFRERDCKEDELLDPGSDEHEPTVGVAGELSLPSDQIPAPVSPSPSLWLLGRVWMLRPMPPQGGRMYVRWGGGTLGLSGDYVLASTLQTEWRKEIAVFVAESARRLAEGLRGSEKSAALGKAREFITRNGCLEMGDLLYIPGNPPYVGHVLPPHYNRVLGRRSHRDLAVAAPLVLPPRVAGPYVYRRRAAAWEPFALPHGLCLGPAPPAGWPDCPGLALAAYLRWAAIRLAMNGRFHSSDS
jgi:hypothetical protein